MKIKKSEVRQFGHIMLTCHPQVMQQVLDVLTNLYTGSNLSDAKERGYNGSCCHMFRSGAKLHWRGRSSYSIYCYSHDASDGLAAVEELKMADHLRLANRHYEAAKKLRCSLPIDGQSDMLIHSREWKYVRKAA